MTKMNMLAASLGSIPDLEIARDLPLAQYTTFRIGGIADLYITPLNIQSLTDLSAMEFEMKKLRQ